MVTCPGCGRQNRDSARFCDGCGHELSGAREALERKRVSVVFFDLVGSTALGARVDAEVFRTLVAQYHEAVADAVERHGGAVHKLIGDGVLAVFGVPLVHEDDAVRAARAAFDARAAVRSLSDRASAAHGARLELRVGVNTGELLAGASELLGDTVNTAKRLEEAAGTGEILLAAETVALARDAVETQSVGELDVKGKADPVAAFRLLAIREAEAGVGRRHSRPLVGRVRELRMLREAFDRAAAERACHLFTLLGPAGIGKSRLAEELLAGLGDATVVRGRCLSYGEGVAYRPVVEAVGQLLGADPDERLRALGLDESARAGVLSVLSDDAQAVSAGETARGIRALLEGVARSTPLVAVFDDVHWGEPTFLDLVDHLAETSRGAPILLLCLARPELFERRPGWGGGKANATSLLLDGLGAEEATRLLAGLLGDTPVSLDAQRRVLGSAEGNPFFLEELVALVRESGSDTITIPPTVQALLAARLDQLTTPERLVLAAAAVEGKEFHREAVEALSGADDAGEPLESLVRKQLIDPLPGERSYRFRHLLFRDAAYDALPKARRAGHHAQLADWFETERADAPDLDELVGYHLEQSLRYRAELGAGDDPEAGALAQRAEARLAAAAARAETRNDLRSVVRLLERIRELRGELEPELAIDLVNAHRQLSDLTAAAREAAVALDRASRAGDRSGELRARLAQAEVAVQLDPARHLDAVAPLAREAVATFERAGDWQGVAEAELLLGLIEFRRSRFGAVIDAVEPALEHARRAGKRRLERRALGILAGSHIYGPTPVDEAIPWLEAHTQAVDDHSFFLEGRAFLEAARGELERARALQRAAETRRLELGVPAVNSTGPRWEVAMLAAQFEEAAAVAATAVEHWQRHGERGYRSTAAAELALALCRLGELEEGERWSRTAEELAPEDDTLTHMFWRQARALVLAGHDRTEEAVRLAREAVELGERAQMPNTHAGAYATLASILVGSGRSAEAQAAAAAAVRLYEAKGNTVSAAAARSLLER
ncbi:MAG TPA: adenylate/guanylate cyclase domain-containing protein [Gaiellaceae bacterium]|nr:adenylate/guanylate cyclase domain-containing protein [Gaiellaceae bacterium]